MLNLKQIRRKQGVRPVELYRHLGVNPDTLWRWEAGTRVPSIPTLVRISDYLGVSVSDLINHEAARQVKGA